MYCLILAGGESLPDILKGRSCHRPGWFTIGVNLAYMMGDWVDVCFFMDALMWWNHKDGLSKFRGRKISLNKTKEGVKSIAGHAPGVELWIWGGGNGISTEPGRVLQNRSSGGAAINLAYHLGAKRVFLLGYDMHGNADGWMRNWYPEQWQRHSKKGYHNMLLPFDKIAADAKRLGMEILNATPGSAITQFPFVNIEDYQCLT